MAPMGLWAWPHWAYGHGPIGPMGMAPWAYGHGPMGLWAYGMGYGLIARLMAYGMA